MKLFLACLAAFTISATSAKWTCEDCTAVVNSMSAYLTSGESMQKQVDILLADVCPQVENSEECVEGLQKGVEQLLQEETIAAIVEALSGDAFCGQGEDPERCAAAIQTLIPLALPALTANPDEEAGKMVCN